MQSSSKVCYQTTRIVSCGPSSLLSEEEEEEEEEGVVFGCHSLSLSLAMCVSLFLTSTYTQYSQKGQTGFW